MKCKNCGATLDEGALFCRKCGTAVPQQPEPEKHKFTLPIQLPKLPKFKKPDWKLPDLSGLFHNKKVLLMGGIALLLLIVLITVIVAAASCKPDRFNTPEDVQAAVIDALQDGDGDRLAKLAKTSEAFFGQHPEQFGEGRSPEAVMKGYYNRLADDVQEKRVAQYGKRSELSVDSETETLTGTAIFQENDALEIDATAYAVLTGPLLADGQPLMNLRIVAAEIDGRWKLIAVYTY